MAATDTAPVTTPSTELAVRDLQLDRLARLGTWLAATEKRDDPRGRDGMAGALRFYYADQLGLPATAVAELTVVHGRLFIGAQLMRALAERAGYRVIRRESSDVACTAVLVSTVTGLELGEVTFDIEQARRAGMIRQGSAWHTFPDRMLWARASTYVIRDFAPGVSLGLALTDELTDPAPEYAEAIEVEDGDDEPLVADEPIDESYADFEPAPAPPDLDDIPFGEDPPR